MHGPKNCRALALPEQSRLEWLQAYPPFHHGRYLDSKQSLDRADALLRGSESPLYANVLVDRAVIASNLGSPIEAHDLAQRALEMREQLLGPEHLDVADSLSNLVYRLAALGEVAEARDFAQKALEMRVRLLGPEHPEVATSLGVLANRLAALGEMEEARDLAQRSLEMHERLLGPEHPHVATSLGGLANHLAALGNPAGARELAQRALEMEERLLGPEHPDVATSLGGLANHLAALGEVARARDLAQRSLEMSERLFGPEHPDVATSLNNLASLDNSVASLKLKERALTIRRARLGPNHPLAMRIEAEVLVYRYFRARTSSLYAMAKNLRKRIPKLGRDANYIRDLLRDIENHPLAGPGVRKR